MRLDDASNDGNLLRALLEVERMILKEVAPISCDGSNNALLTLAYGQKLPYRHSSTARVPASLMT